RNVRELRHETGKAVALIADLQGPKLRIADIDGTRVLETGSECVVAGEGAARDGDLPVAPAVIGEVLQPGHDVLISDGLVRLRVEDVADGRARCAVVVGGPVSSHKG